MGKKSFYLISGLFLVIGGVLPWMAETGVDSSGRTPDRGKIIIEDRMISAELKNMPLGLVLRQVEEQGNIWTRGVNVFLKRRSMLVSSTYLWKRAWTGYCPVLITGLCLIRAVCLPVWS